jgi:hypothetical protein
MKKKYILGSLAFAAVGIFSFQKATTTSIDATIGQNIHAFNAYGAGSPGGRAGAPGDAACASCHSVVTPGNVADNQLVVTSGITPITNYIPGTTYNVGITINNAVLLSGGFELAVLNASNAQAGTLTGIAAGNSKTVVSGSTTRGTHLGPSTTSWGMTWTAPATNVGPVTFYLSTYEGTFAGGSLRVSNSVLGSTASITEEAPKVDGSVYFNANSNSVVLDINAPMSGDLNVRISDLSGKTIEMARFGFIESGEISKTIRLSESVPSGAYVITTSVGNNFLTKRIFVGN